MVISCANRFHHQRLPLIILVCGTACVGKSTLATQLAQRLNLPNVLQVSLSHYLHLSDDITLLFERSEICWFSCSYFCEWFHARRQTWSTSYFARPQSNHTLPWPLCCKPFIWPSVSLISTISKTFVFAQCFRVLNCWIFVFHSNGNSAPLVSTPVWARDFSSPEELITEFCRECRIVRKGLLLLPLTFDKDSLVYTFISCQSGCSNVFEDIETKV